MLKISLEMIDEKSGESVKAEINDSELNQHCVSSDVIQVIPRLLMAAGWFPESIFESMETWVDDNRCLYGEDEE